MLTPRTRGLTLVPPQPHLCFTGTHILTAKATREERLTGSRSRTLYFDAAGLELGELGPSLVIWGPHAGTRPPRLAQPCWNCPVITPGCDLAHLPIMRLPRGPLQLRAPSRHLLGSVRRLVPRGTGQGSRHQAPSSQPPALENLSVTLPGGWWRLGPPHGRGQGTLPSARGGQPLPLCKQGAEPQGRPMSLPTFLPQRSPGPVDSPPTGGSCPEWWGHMLRSFWAHVSCGFQKRRLR